MSTTTVGEEDSSTRFYQVLSVKVPCGNFVLYRYIPRIVDIIATVRTDVGIVENKVVRLRNTTGARKSRLKEQKGQPSITVVVFAQQASLDLSVRYRMISCVLGVAARLPVRPCNVFCESYSGNIFTFLQAACT